MESITIKVDPAFARQMDKAMRPFYSTKTEFIRAAIREKIKRESENDEMIKVLNDTFGKAKTHTSDEELHRIRDRVFEELAKKHGIVLKKTTQSSSSGNLGKAISRSS